MLNKIKYILRFILVSLMAISVLMYGLDLITLSNFIGVGMMFMLAGVSDLLANIRGII